MKRINLFLTILLVAVTVNSFSQKHPDFEIIKQCKTSKIKNQQRAGTCWSYAALSFIESEMLRTTNTEFDLSEIYIVRYAYISKAKYYVQLHGIGNFSQGGQAHDVTNEIVNYGLMTEEAYSGLVGNNKMHDHSKLEKDLKEYLDSIIKLDEIPKDWLDVYTKKLDEYLGIIPDYFDYKSNTHTPKDFQNSVLNFNTDDYVELTSYSHHDYYKSFDLEVPDNWSHDYYYNLPIDEFMQVIDNAINNDFSICWDGDVSEENFNHKEGKSELKKGDIKEIKKQGIQEYRQETFNNQTTTDDHLMHLTGIAENKKGEKYYIIKNSWGDSNDFGGYLYMSENFVKLKTVAIMIHKDAIPVEIRDKMNF